eukprot:scaffold110458_cov63-Phaeocystis_antarctica.AAC.1
MSGLGLRLGLNFRPQRLNRVDQLHVCLAARDVLCAQQAVGEQEHLDRTALRRGSHRPQPGCDLRRGARIGEARGRLLRIKYLLERMLVAARGVAKHPARPRRHKSAQLAPLTGALRPLPPLVLDESRAGEDDALDDAEVDVAQHGLQDLLVPLLGLLLGARLHGGVALGWRAALETRPRDRHAARHQAEVGEALLHEECRHVGGGNGSLGGLCDAVEVERVPRGLGQRVLAM